MVLPTFASTFLDDVKPSAVRTWIAAASSWLADAGTPILDIAAYQGHSRIQVTLN